MGCFSLLCSVILCLSLSTTAASATVKDRPGIRLIAADGRLVTSAVHLSDAPDSFLVKTYGAKCDGTTNDTAAFKSAYTAAAKVEGTVKLPLGTCVVDSLVTPANVTTRFENGSVIHVNTGQSVTMSGPMDATPTRHFANALADQGRVVFTGNTAISTVLTEWWGAKADNSTNSSPFFNAAVAALGNGGTIRLLVGTYAMATGIVLTNSYIHFEGSGAKVASVIRPTARITLFQVGTPGPSKTSASYIRFSNLWFNGNEMAGTVGLSLVYGNYITVDNCRFSGFGNSGVLMPNTSVGTYFLAFKDTLFTSNGGYGVEDNGVVANAIAFRGCNVIANKLGGLYMNSISTDIEGGSIEDNGGIGVSVGLAGVIPYISGFSMHGTYLENNALENVRLGLEGVTAVKGASITGCYINGLHKTVTGVNIQNAVGFLIAGNSFHDLLTRSILFQTGGYSAGVVVGNSFTLDNGPRYYPVPLSSKVVIQDDAGWSGSANLSQSEATGTTMGSVQKFSSSPGTLTIKAGSCLDVGVPETSATDNDLVWASPSYPVEPNISWSAFSVRGSGFKYRICNPTPGNITTAAGARWTIWKLH